MTFRITRPVVSRDVEERKLAGDRARDFTTAVKDLNGDGFDDVLVVGMNGSPRNGREKQQGFIFLNDKRGGFTEAKGDKLVTLGTSEVLVEDFNGDGRLDFFNADFGHDFNPFLGGKNQLFFGTANGGFKDVSGRLPNLSDLTHSAAAGDIDGDGDIDIYVGNLPGPGDVTPYFLINNGKGRFTLNRDDVPTSLAPQAVATGEPRKMLSSELVDLNGDGALDLLLGRDQNNALGGDADRIFFNDGSGGFSDADQLLLPTNKVGRGQFT
ncbi:MAG: VCBS repeat-containing protein, partial [Pseudomonadota bacterium]